MCIQLRSNQILNYPYITRGIIQERGEVLLTAVCKTIFLISLALIEIEEASLCHSISLPKRNLKNTKVLASFELSHLDCLVLFTDPVTSGHANGNFLFTSGRGLVPAPLYQQPTEKHAKSFFQIWGILLVIITWLLFGFFMLHLYTKPQEEPGILCAVMWSVKPAAL